MLFVIPAPGLTIPDPAARGTPDYHLPAEGRMVEDSTYWQRRIADGDVTQTELVLRDGGTTDLPDSPAIDPT